MTSTSEATNWWLPEFAGRGVVVGLLDVLALLGAAADPDHPQELVDVCRIKKALSQKIFKLVESPQPAVSTG